MTTLSRNSIDVEYRVIVPVPDTSYLEETGGFGLQIIDGWTPSVRIWAQTFSGNERLIMGDLRNGAVIPVVFDRLRFEYVGASADLFHSQITIAIHTNRRVGLVETDQQAPAGRISDLTRVLIQNVAAGAAFTLWDDAVNSTTGVAPEDRFTVFNSTGTRDVKDMWLGGWIHAGGIGAAPSLNPTIWLFAYGQIDNTGANNQPYPIAQYTTKNFTMPASLKASTAGGGIEYWWRPEHSEQNGGAAYGVRWPQSGGKLVILNNDAAAVQIAVRARLHRISF